MKIRIFGGSDKNRINSSLQEWLFNVMIHLGMYSIHVVFCV